MNLNKFLLAGAASIGLTACGQEADTKAPVEKAADVAEKTVEKAADVVAELGVAEALDAALAAQSDEAKARYQYRNPAETLGFFGIAPGMTVVEALPGGGWYSKILLPYLGADGKLIGTDYSLEMWPLFGGFATEEFIEKKKTWVQDWTASAEEWRGDSSASVSAYVMGSMPDEVVGTADAVLFIRALHNLSRFESEGGFRTQAIDEAFKALKPGGIVGVVQHRAPDSNSKEWADGSNGYVGKDDIVAAFEAAGFELAASSEINANPKDQPTEDDIVWRLPPSLATSKEDPELRAKMVEIGESDRMTLKFVKPE